ncbi:helix-turn-helix domain-containing protein [Paenibacillus turpanensis]|uniref:helix-turn-helix domain-containing protein n=1 Tax=Paenibacillus turpanensis TaxID=2689078 RepID=UPI00140C2583|nr:helix-turn-helix domain-containing protein [Paenibacillus turpanensis]
MGANDELYRNTVNQSLDYIEKHLTQTILLKDVSKIGMFSKHHFYRVFYSVVGSTLADYVRTRRLTKAALELAHTNERILDIALKYHFQSQEAFTRAFKKMFHLTPRQYREYSKSLLNKGGRSMSNPKTTAPEGWTITGQNTEGYRVTVDEKEVHVGRAAARLESITNHGGEGFVTLMQMFAAEAYAGKRLKLTAFVKSELSQGWAGVWMRVDHRNGDMLKFDNMQDRPIQGTCDWNQFAVVLDIPKDSDAIAFGILLSGEGRVWADNFSFEVVDEKTPTTDKDTKAPLPPEPLNLNFEQK